jgi:parallel beta-helix repeat protein
MNNRRYIKFLQAATVITLTGLLVLPVSAGLFTNQMNYGKHPMLFGGTTIYVDQENTAGPWEGTMEHPYRFIQDGVDAATAGDTVYVFDGTYYENVVVTVSLNLTGENSERTIIDGKSFGTVLNIYAEGVTVTSFTITHCGGNPNNAGILIHTPYNVISQNNIQHNNYFGLLVLEGNNTIYHNNFVKNTYQAFDEPASSAWDNGYPCGGNYWSDYTGTDENEDGIGEIPVPTGNSSTDRYPLIHSYGSIRNQETQMIFLTIQAAIDNITTLNGHHIQVEPDMYYEHVCLHKTLSVSSGSGSVASIHGRYTGSVITINNNSVVFSGFTILGSGNGTRDAGILLNASDCEVSNCMMSGNFQGILLTPTAMDNVIMRNVIMQNRWNGLMLESGCKGNSIVENNIMNNNYAGVGIVGTTGNYVYHNNFVENRYNAYDDGTNVWDDGYPSGGNFWDDYDGVDEDQDGIGDTPYAILNGFNSDQHPLMAAYTGGDTIPPKVTIMTPVNGLYIGNLRFLPWLFQQSTILIGPITVEVEASDAQSGIDRVEFVIDDSSSPAYVDNIAPYSWKWSKPSLLFHRHTIIVVAYDKKGNPNYDMVDVQRYL